MTRLVIIKGGPGSGHHGHAGRPGEVGGSAPSKGRTRTLGGHAFDKVSEEFIENYIDADIEHGAIVNEGGWIEEFTGGKTGIDIEFTPMEAIQQVDGYFIHNHPSGVPISPDDLAFAVRLRLKEMVTVGIRPTDGKRVKYTLARKPGEPWGFDWEDTVRKLHPFINSYDQSKYYNEYHRGRAGIADYHAWTYIWTTFADRYSNITYTEEEL